MLVTFGLFVTKTTQDVCVGIGSFHVVVVFSVLLVFSFHGAELNCWHSPFMSCQMCVESQCRQEGWRWQWELELIADAVGGGGSRMGCRPVLGRVGFGHLASFGRRLRLRVPAGLSSLVCVVGSCSIEGSEGCCLLVGGGGFAHTRRMKGGPKGFVPCGVPGCASQHRVSVFCPAFMFVDWHFLVSCCSVFRSTFLLHIARCDLLVLVGCAVLFHPSLQFAFQCFLRRVCHADFDWPEYVSVFNTVWVVLDVPTGTVESVIPLPRRSQIVQSDSVSRRSRMT